MCLICVDLFKQKMTLTEAKRAAREMYQFGDDEDIHLKRLAMALEEDDFEELSLILDEAKEAENA